ncbi:3-deoxy-manno-octulosonate cytidylyltransferase [Campylobacter sp. VBCF_05 NA6]|uniref:3-deoxy-manno-octulosonate cytidylyltransferase n=1 Tax=unclassified Campylobacter TaxID=2593542 RepID=UPI0022E9D051|nr:MULTISPECIES: 3-deoxy-manno-octulosonate cytidylyltransferase [unclassified Campylobacter]MDA3056900.1 3-deoxy-manno-octulosonate cytidylyltransferase [Campylobacter sp. VBCF_04 NA7]MDA3058668.1 3-deoxy-manno-octulosonate cytidylyltransferase [Campylobacter sp. VBCF_05 NA6]
MIIIPARLASTRFKNKILCEFAGVPMFIKTAQNAAQVDNVLIAVDDEKILQIAKDYGFRAVMTDENHQSGTDRINEAVKNANLSDDEILINVQADEPFFETQNLIKFKEFATSAIKNGAFMASCYKKIDEKSAQDPNLVKVILDNHGFAIYFSRAPIPYPRAEFKDYLGHIGIYAYSAKTLREFCALPPSVLENTEKLEQLRALSAGKKIAMLQIETNSVGIDTQEDYEKALKIFGK